MASLLREQSGTRLAKVSRQKNEQEQVISKVKEKVRKHQNQFNMRADLDNMYVIGTD